MQLVNSPCSATNEDQSPYSWWHADFDKAYTVKRVRVLTYNLASDPDIGWSMVYIGGKKCHQFHDDPPAGRWKEFECHGDGITGSDIKIQRTTEFHLMVCGIEVYGHVPYNLM